MTIRARIFIPILLVVATLSSAAPGFGGRKAAVRDPRLDPLRRAVGAWEVRASCEGNFLPPFIQKTFNLEDRGDHIAAMRLKALTGRMDAWGPITAAGEGNFRLKWDPCVVTIKLDERASSASYSFTCGDGHESKVKSGIIKMNDDWTSGEATEHDRINGRGNEQLASECRIAFTKAAASPQHKRQRP